MSKDTFQFLKSLLSGFKIALWKHLSRNPSQRSAHRKGSSEPLQTTSLNCRDGTERSLLHGSHGVLQW